MSSAPGADDARALIRSQWRFPAVCHFCSVFRAALGLPAFSPGELENAVLDASSPLPELHWKLTHIGQDLARSRNAKASGFPGWESALAAVLKSVQVEEEDIGVVLGRVPYGDLSPVDRLRILHVLCCRSLDVSDEIYAFCTQSPSEVVADPIGIDANGTSYYRFSDDAWLFTEKVNSTKGRRDGSSEDSIVWGVATTTLAELRDLATALDGGKNASQKAFVKRLREDILPALDAAEKSRLRSEYKRNVVAFMPRRQSSRIQTKMAEEEELRAQLEAAEEEERIKQEERERIEAERRELEIEHARELRAQRREQQLLLQRTDSPRPRSRFSGRLAAEAVDDGSADAAMIPTGAGSVPEPREPPVDDNVRPADYRHHSAISLSVVDNDASDVGASQQDGSSDTAASLVAVESKSLLDRVQDRYPG
ncbi:hypothetical protein PBRA_006239 [Plasmodiophora brassicae]|uniref:WHIM1 domain-containing protein n=1 Tax=Plasmodiophora brassicae TaxID=37360 RepID=A0A0G4ISB9_PLABS|nr:hypothetical protein PBRA_006239 [Plasmodiophora brassicae]